MNIRDLAAILHLHRLPNGSWRGTCPSCGYPGAFSLRQGEEGGALWWCASCQDRDAVTAAIRAIQGDDWTPPPTSEVRHASGLSPARRSAFAQALWHEAVAIRGTPAEAYLAARLVLDPWLAFAMPEDGEQLRFHPRATHPEMDGRFPALVSLVRRATDGEPIAVHRTYLAPNGQAKAAVEPQKATLGPIAGGIIALHQHGGHMPIVIAEGIETALSASALMQVPAWAAISAGNLERLDLPQSLQDIIVAADPDAPGQRAANSAALRWKNEGRQARVATPDERGTDFNDILAAQHREGGSHA